MLSHQRPQRLCSGGKTRSAATAPPRDASVFGAGSVGRGRSSFANRPATAEDAGYRDGTAGLQSPL
ncbi:hypothetical protein [Natrinema altunense]|uniref:Uncharacterized protein n=1 Tax=Natrinema altunense TaxID=222984 RepID=A0A482XWG1_9EURY|nr:hypothetical protein [Natrinema altunense]RZH67979.1 hypothetical protein ELS17_00440 [Natrinema altunense]